MAMSNATTIILKNSGTTGNVPAPANLQFGELAINYADGILYYKAANGTVLSISGGGGGAGNSQLAFNQANLAFDQANIAITIAISGYEQANIARDHANGSFANANAAGTIASAAFDAANAAGSSTIVIAAFDQANTARDQANTATLDSGAAFNKANIANVTADAAFAAQNVTSDIANAAFANANAAGIIASAAFDAANAAGSSSAAAAFAQANTARDQANNAEIIAISAFDYANGLNTTISSISGNQFSTVVNVGTTTTALQNLYFDLTTGGFFGYINDGNTSQLVEIGGTNFSEESEAFIAIAAFGQANTANIVASAAFEKANAGANQFSTVIDVQSTTHGLQNLYFDLATGGFFAYINDGDSSQLVELGIGGGTGGADSETISAAFNKANTANIVAVAAFNAANTNYQAKKTNFNDLIPTVTDLNIRALIDTDGTIKIGAVGSNFYGPYVIDSYLWNGSTYIHSTSGNNNVTFNTTSNTSLGVALANSGDMAIATVSDNTNARIYKIVYIGPTDPSSGYGFIKLEKLI